MAEMLISDILSVPALGEDLLASNSVMNLMDLEAFAFRKGRDPLKAQLFDVDSLFTTTQPSLPSEIEWIPEVPTFPLPQESVSSDDGFNTEDSLVAPPSPPRQKKQVAKRKQASRKRGRLDEQQNGVQNEETKDIDMEEMLMSPEEEASLRSLLAKRQRDLELCTSQMKGLSPQNKKRLRNRHASCVSRLKKKLYICNIQRDLERAKANAARLEKISKAQEGTIRFFKQENDRMCDLIKANNVSFQRSEVKPLSVDQNEDADLQCPECSGNEGGPMIACDGCSRWFHTECVGLDSDNVNTLDIYYCSNCRQ